MSKIFPEIPLLAFRRDKNLSDTLVHMKTDRSIKNREESCKCKICEIIVRDNILDTERKIIKKTVDDAKCKDRNLIYALLCTK